MPGHRVILVQHGVDRDDNRVAAHLSRSGYEVDIRRPFQGDVLPENDIAGAVIFGGMYNAYDTAEHEFLRREYAFIDRCLKADIPLLGICQGAQMIAHHHGAHVGPPSTNVHEFGWYQLTPTAEAGDFMPEPIHVLQSHWHGFDLPSGAVRLASSALYPNQAFRMGDRVYGFQFHAEVTGDGFREMQERGAHRYALPGVQSRADQDTALAIHGDAQEKWFAGFLRGFFPAVGTRT